MVLKGEDFSAINQALKELGYIVNSIGEKDTISRYSTKGTMHNFTLEIRCAKWEEIDNG